MKTRRDLEHRLSIRTRTLALALVLLLGIGIAAGSGIGASAGPATLALSPTPAIGGTSATGVIQLAAPAPAGGAMFLLRSSNPQIASVPGSIMVPAGQTKLTFPVSTQNVSSSQDVMIGAWSQSLDARLTASLTVSPQIPKPQLSSLSLSVSSIVGGTSLTGNIKLSHPAPSGGASISLGSSNASAASVPATVAIGQSGKEASFTVSTFNVSSSTAVTISASLGGTTLKAALAVNPQSAPPPSPSPSLSSLVLNPSSVTGGGFSVGTVTLSAAAPTGGATVSLTSSNGTVAPVPSSITVAAGSSSSTFSIATTSVSVSTSVSISGSYGGATRSATLTVAPASSPPPPGGGATLYVSSSGSSTSSCTQTAPCSTLDRAYKVAKPGDNVQIANGSYGAQAITLDTTKVSAGSNVSFGPAPGAQVTLASLDIYGSHISVHDVIVTKYWYVGKNSNTVSYANQAHNVTLTNVNARNFYITGAYHVTVKGGSYGPGVNVNSQIKNCYLCSTPPPDDITLDGLYFHDFTRSSTAQHLECLEVYPATHFTLRNSRFFNCAIFDVFIADYAGQYPSNITIENNWFDKAGSHGGSLNAGYYSLFFRSGSGTISNLRIAYNSFLQSFSSDPGSYSGTAVGNAVQGGACISGLAYSHNVMSGNVCGSTDLKANPGFVNAANFILDLVAGSAAINAGDPADYPTKDIHGHARPTGARADAGAQEAG